MRVLKPNKMSGSKKIKEKEKFVLINRHLKSIVSKISCN